MKKAKVMTVFLFVQAFLLLLGCGAQSIQETEESGSLFPAAEAAPPLPEQENPAAAPVEEGGWALTKIILEDTGIGEPLEIFVEMEFTEGDACIMRFLEEPDSDKAAESIEFAWRPDGQLLKFAVSGSTDPPIVISFEYTYDAEGYISQMKLTNGQMILSNGAVEEQYYELQNLYDMDGRLIGTNVEDENGNIIQNILYVPLDHGGTLQMDLTTDLSTSVSFREFDSDGRPLRQTLYALNDGIVQALGSTLLNYDQVGNLTEILHYDDQGEMSGRTLFEYEQNANAPEKIPIWEVFMDLSAYA